MTTGRTTKAGLAARLATAEKMQSATSEVLRLISANPGDLNVVLDGIVAKAAEICGADNGAVFIRQGEVLVMSNNRVIFENDGRAVPVEAAGVNLKARDRRAPVFVDDFASFMTSRNDPIGISFSSLGGEVAHTSFATVALMQNDEWLGNLNLMRNRVDPFDPKFGPILQAFADQAAIAIENSRLFNELQDSNREVSAALEQQTAVAAVLQTISKSAFDLEVVLNELVEQAHKLVPCVHVAIRGLKGREYGSSYVFPLSELAHYDTPENAVLGPFEESVLERNRTLAVTIRASDLGASVLSDSRLSRYGPHSVITVPMRSSAGIVGLLTVVRSGESRFTDSEKQLLQTFADQAVIAIENSRLFKELAESNREVSAALDQQTAVASVLQTISKSAFDLDVVLNELAAEACRLVRADRALIRTLRHGALSEAYMFTRSTTWFDPVDIATIDGADAGMLAVIDRMAENGRPFFRTIATIQDAEGPVSIGNFEAHGPHTYGFVLLTGSEGPIGLLSVLRDSVQRFTDSEKQLLQTFADQGVIAIENSRLFKALEESNREVTEALEQQTAVAAVLQTISKSAFDLDVVLNELTEQANRLVRGSLTNITLLDLGRSYNFPTKYSGVDGLALPSLTNVSGVAGYIGRGRPTWITVPVLNEALADHLGRWAFDEFGPYSFGVIPLARDGVGFGALNFFRSGAERFNDSEKQLLQTFADQAVIAIENARLFKELEERNREVSEALEQQTAIAEVLEVISSSPNDLENVLSQVLGIAARLCGADTALIWQAESERFRAGASHGFTADELAVIDEIVFRLDGNSVASVADGRVGRVDGDSGAMSAEWRSQSDPASVAFVERVRQRAYLMVPLTKPGSFRGVFSLMRRDRRPFTQRDEDVVQTFADQALIAIENSRLFNELTEEREQQAAIAEVLKVIGATPGEIEQTLPAIGLAAQRLTASDYVAIVFGPSEATVVWDPDRGFRTHLPNPASHLSHNIQREAEVVGAPVMVHGPVGSWADRFPYQAELYSGLDEAAMLCVPLIGRTGGARDDPRAARHGATVR